VVNIHVTADGQPVLNLNELEYIHGEIYANIWETNRIARISPATGKVLGWIDLSGLRPQSTLQNDNAVLNGIAYDSQHDRLYVTGKLWPNLYEIKLIPASDRAQ
jgi:glutaminyl-peptide cyclotransferase